MNAFPHPFTNAVEERRKSMERQLRLLDQLNCALDAFAENAEMRSEQVSDAWIQLRNENAATRAGLLTRIQTSSK